MTIFIAGDEESQPERRSRTLAPSQGSFPPVATSLQAVKLANVCNYSLTCMYNGKTIDFYVSMVLPGWYIATKCNVHYMELIHGKGSETIKL